MDEQEILAMQTALGEAQGRLDGLSSQVAFYEEAIGQGVRNPRLAYHAAAFDALVGSEGTDWGELRRRYPELFGLRLGSGVGAGLGSDGPPGEGDMNAWIRRAAGRS
jgi:hypothetical protein